MLSGGVNRNKVILTVVRRRLKIMLIENLNSSSVTSDCYVDFFLLPPMPKRGEDVLRRTRQVGARKTFPDMIEFSAVIYMVRWSAFYPPDWKVHFFCCALLFTNSWKRVFSRSQRLSFSLFQLFFSFILFPHNSLNIQNTMLLCAKKITFSLQPF